VGVDGHVIHSCNPGSSGSRDRDFEACLTLIDYMVLQKVQGLIIRDERRSFGCLGLDITLLWICNFSPKKEWWRLRSPSARSHWLNLK
jgi:hypothetical protein